jgi:hypothetical protein
MIFEQNSKHILASMIYFDSDMSKSTNTVVCFDWKTVIYIYGIFKLFLLRKVHCRQRAAISIFFSFWATFNSFVNARYSDISVDCNDFEADSL